MYKFGLKRMIDFIVSIILLIISFPVQVITAGILIVANKSIHVFFTQVRPGKNGKFFKILKFKTMTDERGVDGKLLPDEKRLTPVGKLIRSLSLDELPQLINVLKGDMSLIGPRPLLVQYLSLYTPEQSRRHEVRLHVETRPADISLQSALFPAPANGNSGYLPMKKQILYVHKHPVPRQDKS